MNFSKSFLVAMVAVGAITLSACGKKKEDPVAAAPASVPAEQPVRQEQQGPIKLSQENVPQALVDRSQGHGKERFSKRGHRPEIQTAPNIQGSKRLSGAQNKDGLLYTSSSQDDTFDQLLRLEASLSMEQQRDNKRLAQSVLGVELFQDLITREATASIKIQEGSSVVIYNMMSVLIENLSSKLNVVNSALGVRSSGDGVVGGKMQCLDLDVNTKTCSNILISMDLKKGHAKSNLKVLVRDSAADMHFEMEESSGNPEFEVFKDFLVSSVLDRDTKAKVKSINMQSFEVLNGRSGFDLQVLGHNNEFMGFRGELLAPQAGSSLSHSVKKTSPRLLDDISGENQLKLNLLNTLGVTRLVMNDGNGKLKLKMSSRAYANYPLDVFTLTFTRRVKAVIDVRAEN